jgi:hypothetical protein
LEEFLSGILWVLLNAAAKIFDKLWKNSARIFNPTRRAAAPARMQEDKFPLCLGNQLLLSGSSRSSKMFWKSVIQSFLFPAKGINFNFHQQLIDYGTHNIYEYKARKEHCCN